MYLYTNERPAGDVASAYVPARILLRTVPRIVTERHGAHAGGPATAVSHVPERCRRDRMPLHLPFTKPPASVRPEADTARDGNLMRNELRVCRARMDITQGQLADAVGVSRQTIISIEKGKYDPSLELAFKIARFFGTTIESIFFYEGTE